MCLKTETILSDKFSWFKRSIKKFKDTVKNLKEGHDNTFFEVISFGLTTYMAVGGKAIDQGKIRETKGNGVYNNLLEIKDDIKLDKSIFGYVEICFLANQVLVKHNFY